MERNKINYWIDIGLTISFVLVFLTGIFKFPALVRYFGWVYNAIPGRTLSRIHDWSGLIMGLLVFVHLAMHWKWMVAMTKNVFKRKEKLEE